MKPPVKKGRPSSRAKSKDSDDDEEDFDQGSEPVTDRSDDEVTKLMYVSK